jgi:hypothetical protein
MCDLHCDVVEGLRRVVWRTVCAALSAESRCNLVHWVLVVRQGTPVGAIDDEDDEGECCTCVSISGLQRQDLSGAEETYCSLG